MVARLEITEQGGGHGCHAGRGRARIFRPFEHGYALLEHAHCRIGEAAIDEAWLLVLEAALGSLHGVVDIAGREEQGLAGFAERRAVRAAMNGLGAGPKRPAVSCRLAHLGYPIKKPPTVWDRGSRPDLFSELFNVAASRSAQITTGSGAFKGEGPPPSRLDCASRPSGLSPSCRGNYKRGLKRRGGQAPPPRGIS